MNSKLRKAQFFIKGDTWAWALGFGFWDEI